MASSDDSAYGKSHSSNDDTSGDANSTSTTSSGNIIDLRTSKNITNPFDSHLFDSFTAFSPNAILKTPATNKTRINTSFQWSIEQRSRILPAMIDESFIHESPDNPEHELQVQRTLDKFWNSQLIAPSPDVIGRTQKPLNFTPSPIVPFSRRNSRLFDSSSSPISRSSIPTSTKESQTDISIPMDFDLIGLLAKHLPQKQHASTPKMIKKFSSFLDKTSSNHDESLPSDAEEFDSLEDGGINLSVAIEQSTTSRGDLGSTSFITEHTTNCGFDLSKISPIKHEMVSPHTRLSPIKEDN
jgi:hypothetical protein